MKRDIERLKNKIFDLLVIGGGINGCAIARDASLRGAKVALIEKNDFACGASGKTTKLIHGGIRYLEQFNFKLVYEALHERAILLKTVPHLVKPLEFIIPVYKGGPRPLFKIKSGVFLYDLLAIRENIRKHRALKRDDLIALEANIEPHNLKGGVSYYDAQMDDIRLCLDNAISAYDAGCCVANKVEAIGFTKEKERICGIKAEDNLTNEKFIVRARVIVNATGAWSNRIMKMDNRQALAITRPTKGVHIIYRKLPHKHAIVLSARKDKRIFFIIPWRGFSLIGTTDTDYCGSFDEVYADFDDVEYLLEETRRVFPLENIDRKGIIITYASLRPLVNTQGRPASQVSREHLICISPSGLISLVGGKYTTYRRLAEQVVGIVLSKLGKSNFKECVTGGVGPYSPSGELDKTDLSKVIEHAVKNEMANSLSDLLVRRLQVFFTPSHGLDRLEEYARIMSGYLGWETSGKEFEMNRYKEEVRRSLCI